VSCARGVGVYAGPVFSKEQIEKFFEWLGRLPKHYQTLIWTAFGVLVFVGASWALITWLTRPELTLVVTTDRSTLVKAEQAWVDDTSKAIREEVANEEYKSKPSEFYTRSKKDIAELEEKRKKHTLTSDEHEWFGRYDRQIEMLESEQHSAARDAAAWKLRVKSLFASTPDLYAHAHDHVRIVVNNDTKKPLSSIRIVVKGITDVWHCELSSPDILDKSEIASWQDKFQTGQGDFSTLLPPLPSLPAKRAFTVDLYGNLGSIFPETKVSATTPEEVRISVVPVLALEDEGTIAFARVAGKVNWIEFLGGLATILVAVFGPILKRYTENIRSDVFPDHARFFARRLISQGLSASAARLLIDTVERHELPRNDVLRDPNLKVLWDEDEFRAFFSRVSDRSKGGT
jgi:hypothetical protein